LVNGGNDILVVFQLYDDGRPAGIKAWDKCQVGKASARGKLPVNDIVVLCPNVGYGEYAGQGVLIVI